MKKFQLIISIVFSVCVFGQSSWASKAYVTDSFEITLRTGPSIENKIITLVRSDQAVEVLEVKDTWSRVRLLGRGEDTMEGWLLSRYLETRLPWKTQAISLKEENNRLNEKLRYVEEKWREEERLEQELKKELEENTEALRKLRKEHESLKKGAANYLNTKAEYDSTVSLLEAAQKEVQRLTKENDILRSSQRNKWFAMGALVVLFGLLIGVVVGRQEKRRKSLYY